MMHLSHSQQDPWNIFWRRKKQWARVAITILSAQSGEQALSLPVIPEKEKILDAFSFSRGLLGGIFYTNIRR